jgi:intein/homing endonuclease
MKILLVSDSPLKQTGYGRQVRDLHRMYKDLGHETVFIGMHSEIENTEMQEFDGSKVYAMKGPLDPSPLGRWEGPDKHWLQQSVLKENPDIIIMVWDLRKLLGIVRDFDRFFRCPIYLYWLFDSEPISHHYVEFLKNTRVKILPITQCISKWLDNLSIPYDWKPIPEPVDLTKFYPMPTEVRERLKVTYLGENANKVCFGFVGGNFQRKNIPFIIDAFACLPPEILNDSVLFLHTDPGAHEKNPHSFDLHKIIDTYHPDLKDKIIFSQANNDLGFNMAEIYNVMDWQVSGAHGEGWGLCLGADTLVTKADGTVKPIKSINVGELVLTKSGSIKPVVKTFSRTADTIKIKPRYFPEITITPDHPVYAIRRKGKKLNAVDRIPEWIKASELRKGDLLAVLKPKMGIPLFGKGLDCADFIDECKSDETHVWKKMGYSGKTGELVKIKRHISMNQKFMTVAGWYLAEGSCDGMRRLVFDLHVDELNIAKKLQNYLYELFGVMGTLETRENKSRLRVASSILCELFSKLFGRGAHNKQIDPIVLYNSQSLVPLLKGYISGDGCKSVKRGEYNIVTVSQNLAWQIHNILLSHNICSSIHSYDIDSGVKWVLRLTGENDRRLSELFRHESRSTNRKRGQSFIENDRFFFPTISSITEGTRQKVYDLSILEDHSFIANGIVVHNCTVEGMACGVPMIIGDISTSEEILGEVGFRIPIAGYIYTPQPFLRVTVPDFEVFVQAMAEAHKYFRSPDSDQVFPEWDIRSKSAKSIGGYRKHVEGSIERAKMFSIEKVRAMWKAFFDDLENSTKPHPDDFPGWKPELVNEAVVIQYHKSHKEPSHV